MEFLIGLIVNPVAGMGGSVGLKGTDGKIYFRALESGALPVTPGRTRELLHNIKHKDKIKLIVAPGKMGEEIVKEFSIPFEVIGEVKKKTSAEDTKRISTYMLRQGVKLLVFVGGDGTARDVYDAIKTKLPVVAVPGGVKIFSSVFAVNARAAAEMIDAFVEGSDVKEEEVLDIDEDAFRDDRLASKLYGYLVVPNIRKFLQPGKIASAVNISTGESKESIAAYTVKNMEPDTLYLLGPGTTVKAITDEMNLKKTLLGIDAVFEGRLIGRDLNENDILTMLKHYGKRKIVVTPLGGNGFIFGRGNKQFSSEVLNIVGRDNIIVVGTRDKISDLDYLRVDTGDLDTDLLLSGYFEVTVGDKETLEVLTKC